MKKIVSIILTFTLIFTLASPAFAYSFDSGRRLTTSVPCIVIAGDGNALAYDNETKSFQIGNMLDLLKEGGDKEDGNGLKEATMNILMPFILEGIATNNWDNYYDAVYKEISEAYADIRLDENGDSTYNDMGIYKSERAQMDRDMTVSRVLPNGRYPENTYEFFYDWRLSPLETADQLDEYIKGIKKATGCDKVEIAGRCLGTNIILAYLQRHGTADVKGVGLDVSTSLGAEFTSGMISGKFGADGSALSRYAYDIMLRDEDFALNEEYRQYYDLLDFAAKTVELLQNTGALGKLSDVAVDLLYSKIEYGIISALALSTVFTFPGYWSVVSSDEFDDAMVRVFGDENSEKREQYAGLIKKITDYHEDVQLNAFDILKSLKEGEEPVNVCMVAKYGLQMVPVLKDGSLLADEYVSVNHASFGATTSTVYETLSDEYIAERTALGYGKYISPDKKIDASTSLFPDYTWFIKGARHADYIPDEIQLVLNVIDADKQLTIDDFDWTQFIVYDLKTETASPMTTENCNTEMWEADKATDRPSTKSEKLKSFIKSLLRWLAKIANILLKKSNSEKTTTD